MYLRLIPFLEKFSYQFANWAILSHCINVVNFESIWDKTEINPFPFPGNNILHFYTIKPFKMHKFPIS